MSIEGMRDAWGGLYEQARGFYEVAGPLLLGGESLEGDLLAEIGGRLDEMLAASERIRGNADEVILGAFGEQYQSISTLLIAAAAVDAMLAADLATMAPEAGADRRRRIAEGEESPSALESERLETLERANRLFLDEETPAPMGGALPADRRQLVEATHGATTDLLDLAVGPSPQLLRGLVVAMSGGAAEILAAVEHVDLLADLQGSAEGLVNRAPRFLREHAAKMLTLRADAKVVGDALELLRQKFTLEPLFARVASCEAANLRTGDAIARIPVIDAEDAASLEAELAALLPGYRRQMEWIGTSAKWLRRGASPLTHLVAPFVGHAAVCGVFVIGIGYVAYSLADRIDARDLGFADRIEGVVRLVEKRV